MSSKYAKMMNPCALGNFSANGAKSEKKKVQEKQDNCICHRGKMLVICKICGFAKTGRARRLCLDHPRTMYLMDIGECPQCLASTQFLLEVRLLLM